MTVTIPTADLRVARKRKRTKDQEVLDGKGRRDILGNEVLLLRDPVV